MPPTDDPTPAQPATDTPAPDLTNPERRAALSKLGTLAAWTAPTLVTLLVSPRAVGNGSIPPDPPILD